MKCNSAMFFFTFLVVKPAAKIGSVSEFASLFAKNLLKPESYLTGVAITGGVVPS